MLHPPSFIQWVQNQAVPAGLRTRYSNAQNVKGNSSAPANLTYESAKSFQSARGFRERWDPFFYFFFLIFFSKEQLLYMEIFIT